MASYNDYYDSRSRPSRRDREHVTRQPREDAHMSSSSSSRSDRHSYDSRYDPRYSYPPPLPADPARSARPPRSPIGKRKSWPPAPIVESEATSLAKEAGSKKLLSDIANDEAPSRGAVDQDPIIEDVPEYLNKFERRFVVVPKPKESGPQPKESGASSKAHMTPPTSEDERAKRGRRRPDKLGLDLDPIAPEFEKRTASPYAFAKPTPTKVVPSAEAYLSPESMTPPPSDAKNKKAARFADAKPASPQRDSTRLSPSSRKRGDYFATGTVRDDHAIDDYDIDTSDSASGVNRRTPRGPRKPKDGSSQSSQSSQTSVVDFASMPLNGPSPRKANLDSRRQTESATTMPKPRGLDTVSRPSPLTSTSNALSDLGQTALFSSPIALRAVNTLMPSDVSRGNSIRGSRNVSPATAVPRASVSPPPSRSPRKAEFSRESSGSGPGSQSSSVAGSRPGTPPTASGFVRMPKMPPMPSSDSDWDNVMAANALQGRGTAPKAPSRLSTSMRMDSMPGMPRMNSATFPGPSRQPGAVPYPLEDGPATPSIYMPTERDHQFFAPGTGVLNTQESKTTSRDNSPAPNSASRSSIGRPNFPARHSLANTSPIESRPPPPLVNPKRPDTQRKTSLNSVPPTKQEVEAMIAKGMPGCPRAEPIAGYDDWYTLMGAPNLDFCPDCIGDVFERTVYRSSFRRSPPRSMSTKVQCAFGTPWIRLAWLLTLQHRKADLVLMRDLAEIEETSDPCPGDTLEHRSWYGLRDQDALFVRDFHICYADVRKIERLLPTLSGLFVRLPHRASYEKRKCALRTESNRFSVYCDKILDMHDKATASRKLPDPMPLIDLVERKLRIRECERDNMLLGGLWHFIPSVPEFTVCEDCYEEIVEPEYKKNSDVAMRFNRAVQPVYGEGIGTSCQLYSRRMRKVFKTAIKDNDIKYLARKAKERRDAELRLQERYRDILRQAKRLEVYGSEDDERRMERELEKISIEWKGKWE